jgi:hypothetical protein
VLKSLGRRAEAPAHPWLPGLFKALEEERPRRILDVGRGFSLATAFRVAVGGLAQLVADTTAVDDGIVGFVAEDAVHARNHLEKRDG